MRLLQSIVANDGERFGVMHFVGTNPQRTEMKLLVVFDEGKYATPYVPDAVEYRLKWGKEVFDSPTPLGEASPSRTMLVTIGLSSVLRCPEKFLACKARALAREIQRERVRWDEEELEFAFGYPPELGPDWCA